MERLSQLCRASRQLASACRLAANDTSTSNKTLWLTFFVATQLLIFWACSHDRIAQNDEAGLPKGYEERYYEGMRYGLFVPPSYDSNQSYPLIISLHGSTDTVSWDLSWYHDPIQTTNPCFVLTPKSLVAGSGWGTSWTSEHSADMKKTLAVVELLRHEFNLNRNRLYVYGVSMGGFGVYSVLSKEPGMFAAAFSICGGGNPAIASMIAQTPLWIFHGSADPVVPVRLSRDMYRAILEANGRHVRYTEYPGVGHAAWTPAWQDPTLTGWLLAQEQGIAHGRPDTVENFRAQIVNGSQVKLLWDSPFPLTNPNNQIWYYRMFRDFSLIAEVDNTHFTFVDTSVTSVSKHWYSVSAVNYFFQESIQTTAIAIEIPSPLP